MRREFDSLILRDCGKLAGRISLHCWLVNGCTECTQCFNGDDQVIRLNAIESFKRSADTTVTITVTQRFLAYMIGRLAFKNASSQIQRTHVLPVHLLYSC